MPPVALLRHAVRSAHDLHSVAVSPRSPVLGLCALCTLVFVLHVPSTRFVVTCPRHDIHSRATFFLVHRVRANRTALCMEYFQLCSLGWG